MAMKFSMNLPDDLFERVQRHREQFRAKTGMITVSTNAVICALLAAALNDLDAKAAESQDDAA